MASKKRRVRQYKWLKRLRKHGFRARKKTTMLSSRRAKGRASLAPQKKAK